MPRHFPEPTNSKVSAFIFVRFLFNRVITARADQAAAAFSKRGQCRLGVDRIATVLAHATYNKRCARKVVDKVAGFICPPRLLPPCLPKLSYASSVYEDR